MRRKKKQVSDSYKPHINRTYVDEDELMDLCDRYFTAGIQGKFYYMIQWMQNINMLAGNQWIKYNEHKKMFEIDPNLDGEERVTFNKMISSLRMAVGGLLRDRMRARVLHGNQDEESIDSAKVATHLLEHIRRTNGGIVTQKEMLYWSAICGKGILKKWWNPDDEEICDEIIQPFEFIVPPNVRELDKMPWVCHARYETVEWVYDRYGLDMEGEGATDYGQYGSFLASVKNIMEDGYFVGMGANMLDNNLLVKEFWFRPSKKYPKGLTAIIIGDKLVYADKNPISKDDDEFYFPFNELDFFDMPFRYWPMGLIEPVIGIQTYINKFHSYSLENFKYAGAPVLFYQEGSINDGDIVMEAGAAIPYTGNTPPHFEVPNAISPQMFTVIQQLEGAISDILGSHMFGPGMLPPGVHAAAALAIINEQDQVTRMTISINLEEFIRRDAQMTLYLVRKFYPDKEKIRILGTENRWEVVEFDKSMLNGEEEITIESKQELAQDKMTRFDQVLKLMTTPRIDNPQEPILDTNDGLRILELEEQMETTSLRNLNWNMAKDENQRMAKGDRVEAYQFEDHKLHIEAHMQYMLRIEFKELSDNVKQAFLDHWHQHQQMLNAAQQSLGSQATQSEQQGPVAQQQSPQMPQMGQPPMGGQQMMQPHMGMPQMPPQMGGMPQMGQQPPMMPQMPQQGATGLAGGLQQGMANMQHAMGR